MQHSDYWFGPWRSQARDRWQLITYMFALQLTARNTLWLQMTDQQHRTLVTIHEWIQLSSKLSPTTVIKHTEHWAGSQTLLPSYTSGVSKETTHRRSTQIQVPDAAVGASAAACGGCPWRSSSPPARRGPDRNPGPTVVALPRPSQASISRKAPSSSPAPATDPKSPAGSPARPSSRPTLPPHQREGDIDSRAVRVRG